MNVLTIIPARGGSKGVPRKNVRMVGGKPLIAWTILAAKESKLGRNCYVSTEDVEIAGVAEDFGAQVIFRPAHFAEDSTPMAEVVKHCLEDYESRQANPIEYILLLQPTSPLRSAEDIDAALSRLISTGADSLLSVTPYEGVHPSKMYTLQGNHLQPVASSLWKPRRQELENIFHRNGAIFSCTRKYFVEHRQLWGGVMISYVMPKERSVDIDNLTDMLLAQKFIEAL
jgi:CMP-N,N'-diacetyllegionaminic acid synthase